MKAKKQYSQTGGGERKSRKFQKIPKKKGKKKKKKRKNGEARRLKWGMSRRGNPMVIKEKKKKKKTKIQVSINIYMQPQSCFSTIPESKLPTLL
jgi:hypothetical protein